MVSFQSHDTLNSTVCFTFATIDDEIIEDAEMFIFHPMTENDRDIFVGGTSAAFSIVIYDNDGEVILC